MRQCSVFRQCNVKLGLYPSPGLTHPPPSREDDLDSSYPPEEDAMKLPIPWFVWIEDWGIMRHHPSSRCHVPGRASRAAIHLIPHALPAAFPPLATVVREK